MTERCEFCYNGHEAIEKAKSIIDSALEWEGWSPSIMPICLMLLDFQMPRKNGDKVIQAIKKHIKAHNDADATMVKVKEPVFIFLTAFRTKTFLQYVESLQVHGVYEKPLQQEQLQEILKMVDDEYSKKME